jgi:CBS domain containing-hemolysin-like protein
MTALLILNFIAVVIFLGFSAFFSGSETALFSLPKIRVQRIAERSRRGQLVANLLEQSQKTLITLLLGNTLVNVAASFFATILILTLFELRGLSSQWGITVSIAGMTFALLVFGEFTPKLFAVHRAEDLSIRVAPPLKWTSILFSPFTMLLLGLTRTLSSSFKGQASSSPDLEELKTMAEMGLEMGVLTKTEGEIIREILQFRQTTVKEVMTPRIEMECVEDEATVSEALEVIRNKGHSRIPVFHGTVDNITGILYAKDLLPWLNQSERQIEGLWREPYFVPESTRTSALLSEFQNRKMHIAMVVDEYGGIEGLVTLDDLLEEIVGDIIDERDMHLEPECSVIDPKTAVASGLITLHELNETLGTEFPEGEFDTLGGFIYHLAGRVPEEEDTFQFGNITFVVQDVVERTLARVKILSSSGFCLPGGNNGSEKGTGR